MQPVLQFRPVEGKENVEKVLRRVDIAQCQIGLQHVQPGRGSVFIRIIARGDQLGDFLQMSGHPQVTGNGHQHVGPFTRLRQHLLINGQRGRHILGLEFCPRLRQARHHFSGRASGHFISSLCLRSRNRFTHRHGCSWRLGRVIGRGGWLAQQSIKKSHIPTNTAALLGGESKRSLPALQGMRASRSETDP